MAEWTPGYEADLPDSAFLLILPGGRKDPEGKTVPRQLRCFPVRNAAGSLDAVHLRHAVDAIPATRALTAAQRAAALDKVAALAGRRPAGSRSKERMPGEIMGLQTRTFTADLELRAGGDGRTVHGRAVPYGQTADIPGGRERFVMGAFARQIAGGQLHTIRLWGGHQTRLGGDVTAAVGKTVELAERPDGLHAAFAMYETPPGETALHLVRTGEVTGLSIGFKAVDGGTKRGADGAFERHAAHLDHVVLTNEPAYAGAVVTAVRSKLTAGSYRRDLEIARGILTRVLTDR